MWHAPSATPYLRRSTCGAVSATLSRPRRSTLDANHLLQRVLDFDEVGLVGHHLVDRLVGAGGLVDHAAVLAAHDTRGLLGQVLRRELLLRLSAAHAPSRAMRARLETFLRALSADDIGARAHAPGDDAEVAAARADRALAGHPHVRAIVALALNVVVVAVHRLVGDLEDRQ